LSEFPYLLILEQGKTEKILLDFLKQHGSDVEWNSEVVSVDQTAEQVTVVVKKENGKEETIIAEYVIGADGARSIDRHALDIPFSGETYKQSLYIVDC